MIKNITIGYYLEPFSSTFEFMHLGEISRELKKNHSSVRKYLNYLEKQGILIFY